MATASTEIDKDILSCSICLEQFINPKYLPCLHSFCESCLKSYISTEVSKEQNLDSFKCPVCRISVKPSDPDLLPEKWAEQMPNNHLIASLLDNYSQRNGSNSRLCDPCTFSKEEIEAQHWCIECIEALCDGCTTCHRKMKVSRNHKIVSINEVEKDSMKMADADEPCYEHKGKVLEVYCIDHGKMCCVICLATKHRECKNIKTIEEMAGKTNITDFTKQMKEIETQTISLANRKQQNIEKVDKKYQDILSSMTNTIAEAKTKLDHLFDKFKTELGQIHKPQRQLLIEKKERIESFQKTIVNGYKILQAVSDKGNVRQLFVTLEKVKSQLGSHTEQLKCDLINDHDVDYDYSVSDIINDIIDSMDSVGTIELTTTPSQADIDDVISSVKSCCNSKHGQIIDSAALLADIDNIEAVQLLEIKSEGSDFTGGVFLDDGNVVFADRHSSELKKYDMSGNVLNKYPLEYSPYDVARLTHDELYVSFFESNILGKYKISDRIQKLKEMKSELKSEVLAYGIVVGKQNIVLSTKDTVGIIDESGNVIRSIPRDNPDKYTYVAASKKNGNGSLYYRDKDAIVCCTMDGTEQFRHQNKLLTDDITGIALDCNENIYVCCTTIGGIYLISKDGMKGRLLLPKLNNIDEPYAIGFDEKRKRFFVTSNEEEISAQIYVLSYKQ